MNVYRCGAGSSFALGGTIQGNDFFFCWFLLPSIDGSVWKTAPEDRGNNQREVALGTARRKRNQQKSQAWLLFQWYISTQSQFPFVNRDCRFPQFSSLLWFTGSGQWVLLGCPRFHPHLPHPPRAPTHSRRWGREALSTSFDRAPIGGSGVWNPGCLHNACGPSLANHTQPSNNSKCPSLFVNHSVQYWIQPSIY